MNVLSEFHFLRPLWLLALFGLLYVAWLRRGRANASSPWQRACDPPLLAVLRIPESKASSWPQRAGYLAAALGILALAGPAWQRVPQPLLKTREARVIVLDLSRSMDAPDLRPSRIAVAREAISRFLRELPGGRSGLVVFAGSAFTVVPLTEDRNLLLHLLPWLTPDVMPLQGGRVADGLEHGLQMLVDGRAVEGELLLVTDSVPEAAALAAARNVAAGGHRLWVVGVGTATGSPVPLADGQLLKDHAGKAVWPVLEEHALEALAAAGRGRYLRLTSDGMPVDITEWTPQQLDPEAAHFATDVWRDEGRWLLLLLAPIAVLAFRRGAVAAGCFLVMAVQPTHATENAWQRWLQNPNQTGLNLLQAGQPAAAAQVFRDARWRGVAAYRAGLYSEAAEAFGKGRSAADHYNRGNALALAGRLAEAVEAYDEALAIEPALQDALFNRALVRRLIGTSKAEALPAGGDAMGGSSGAAAGGRAADEGLGSVAGARAESSGQDGEPRGSIAALASDGHGVADTASGETRSEEQGEPSNARRDGSGAPQSRADAKSERTEQQEAGSTQEGPAIDVEGVAEAAQWLRMVEESPGALLRRKFEREQAARPAQQPDSMPW